jgi:acyl-CoA thioester hydrolase
MARAATICSPASNVDALAATRGQRDMTELKKAPFVWALRVYFEDTDAGGVVYHSRYLNFFERARTEMLRDLGVSQTALKEQHGLIWVVLDIQVAFRQAAKLDDELLVTCELAWTRGVRQGFRQKMTRKSDGVLVAAAELSAALLHADSHRPARVPPWIRKVLTDE